jgi:hypothetical protein
MLKNIESEYKKQSDAFSLNREGYNFTPGQIRIRKERARIVKNIALSSDSILDRVC